MIFGIPHQLLRNDIQHREAVFNDRIELAVQARFDDLGHFALKFIPSLRLVPADLPKLLFRPRDRRLVGAVGERAHDLDHIGDAVRVFDNHLTGGLLTEILKFGKHFFSRAEKQRRLAVGVGEALRRHQDLAVFCVFGVNKMHVAGRNDRLAEAVCDGDDLAVDVFNIRLAGDLIELPVALGIFRVRVGMRGDHKAVVARGLDLQIIVEIRNFQDLFFGALLEHGAVQFARLARRAEDQPFAVLDELRLERARPLIEILGIGK